VRRLAVFAALAVLVGCDHAAKYAAKTALEGRPPRVLAGRFLELRYVENTDVAFNLLRWIPEAVRAWLLPVFGMVGVAVVLAVLMRREVRGPARAALVLVAAGAIGNTLDRLVRGHVVDFIHVLHWPVFNVADVYITSGATLLALAGLRTRRAPAALSGPSRT
jgi:signal peptidase II